MSVIIILGAAVWPDGPSPTLQKRTLHAISLWKTAPDSLIIPCGGVGKHPPSEASVMADLLQAKGVPLAAIHAEDQSTSTYENLRNASLIMNDLNLQDCTIVTNGYHGPRAKLVAMSLGLNARISASDKSDALDLTHIRMTFRELAAIPAYAVQLIWWRWRDRKG